MTAPRRDRATDSSHGRSPRQLEDPATSGPASREVDQKCQAIVDGRRASRELACWCKRFGLGESEFEALRCIHSTAGSGIDQASIAQRLALSPAQVSATVERLRAGGWIAQQYQAHDRRRHLWQLSCEGQLLLERMLAEAHEWAGSPQHTVRDLRPKEAA